MPSGLRGWSYTLKRSITSLKRTSPEPVMSRPHEVKMYPTEPLRDGRAFIEYVVLKSVFGDFEMWKCSPRGTVKSRMAGGRRSAALGETTTAGGGAHHWRSG